MTDWQPTPDQLTAIEIAHTLADMGAPIFAAHRNSLSGDFLYPTEWQHTKPGVTSHNWIERWRPGMALCMVTGVLFDVLDIDPRNGGEQGALELMHAGAVPKSYGLALTPSMGNHRLIARTHLAKGKPAQGVDLQAGADDGSGRGFVFIAPTVRVSKHGPRQGQEVAYSWLEGVDPWAITGRPEDDPGLDALVELCKAQRAPRRVGNYGPGRPAPRPITDPDDPFDSAPAWTAAEASKAITVQLDAVQAAQAGDVNNTLGGAARVLGRFVAGGHLTEDRATDLLVDALDLGGVHSDSWNVANGKGWTAATCIAAGLANGATEPWTVETETAPSAIGAESGSTSQGAPLPGTGTTVAPPAAVPSLLVESPATMAYWLQNALGAGALSGFFSRGGQVVHTPRVDELGYVAPAGGKDDDNGPAEVLAVSASTLTAKIQYSHRCYKEVKDKETGSISQVPAMFPLAAAQRAVDAPEAMGMLRTLHGITHTPMVRADGSLLVVPGYDAATGYLFLPDPGLAVPVVPLEPSAQDVTSARALLDEMTAGFPWESSDDRANYYGMLLTPLLRLITPPSYKMFGITAHQPGSGKTLLADVARIIHGGVLRTEWPEKEYEIKQMTTALLVGTSAPVVHVDNIMGVLKSSSLAGMLTADGDMQERELGQNSHMLTFRNDRTWVFTGNNMSLGGDLVRRTIIISIDPNMASPETREFAIADLKAWVRERRDDLLWALLVLVRNWVAMGAAPAARKQSDSYAAWESAVGGILAAAGVAGSFDAESGRRAAAGGDDDGLAQVLEHLWRAKQGASWTVGEALDSSTVVDAGGFAFESQDWLPASVLEKSARSVASGKKAFGHWLRNRAGRWVTGSDDRAYVIRHAGQTNAGNTWRVEQK